MKTLTRLCASTACALIISATGFASTTPNQSSFQHVGELLQSPTSVD